MDAAALVRKGASRSLGSVGPLLAAFVFPLGVVAGLGLGIFFARADCFLGKYSMGTNDVVELKNLSRFPASSAAVAAMAPRPHARICYRRGGRLGHGASGRLSASLGGSGSSFCLAVLGPVAVL